MKLLLPKNDSLGPKFRVFLVCAEVQRMIYVVLLDDFWCLCSHNLTGKMTNVPVSPKPQCAPLKLRVKNVAITMFYIVKESFCRMGSRSGLGER